MGSRRPSSRQLTAAQIADFRRAWNNPALTYEDIALRVRVPRGSLMWLSERHGFGPRPTNLKLPADIDDILRRDIGYVTFEEIADRYAVSVNTIKKRAAKLGLSAKAVRRQARDAEAVMKPQTKTPNANSHLFARAPKTPRIFAAEHRGDVAVRRFEMGASGQGWDDFLKKCGFTVTSDAGRGYRVVGPNGGRPKRLTNSQLIKLLDQERLKRGLEPIRIAA